jgi:hypothetical protein
MGGANSMMQDTRPLRPKWRTAQRIHDQLCGLDSLACRIQPPREVWQELATCAERLQVMLNRGWYVAGQHVLDDLVYVTRRLERELEAFRQQLPVTLQSKASNPGEILKELSAIEAEFDDVGLDSQERTLCATIGPIELEGVYLGAFQVTLHWEKIGRSRAYVVEALDPCPAEGTEDVTHPHVRDGLLCEGDGTAPIKTALSQGRFYDFFTLVRQILETYNPDSAHVRLDKWDGVSCRDCGSRMSREEIGICERCEDPLCSDCSLHCQACDSFPCSSCSSGCDDCGGYFCLGCLNTCSSSGRNLCPSCLESQQENEDDFEETSETDDPATLPVPNESCLRSCATPVHALCLGQAALPA